MTIHLYAICWNELRLLRFFFRHYESLVDSFVMFDDGSTDGTIEYLRGKPKVEVRPFPRAHPELVRLLAAGAAGQLLEGKPRRCRLGDRHRR